MFIAKQHLSRRTVLKGLGATLSLPLLDAMVPAATAMSRTAAAKGRVRFVAVEMVHGAAGCNTIGANANLWSPAAVGSTFDLSPSCLSPLEPLRDYLTIVSNTDCRQAEAFTTPEIGGDHFRASAVFLTQSHPKQTMGSDVLAGVSIDQVIARRFGQDTPIPSMQLCIENNDQSGGCEYNYSCVYTDSISWDTPNTPMPMIRDPRAAFDALFGAGATPEDRARRRREDKSILDALTESVNRLKAQVGASDRVRLTDYLEHIREVERRIQKTEQYNSSGEPRQLPSAPIGVPDSYTEHAQIMFDLQVLALASEITRVFSFKMSRDVSNRVYPETGVTQGFHNASHHNEREDRVREFNKINKYHIGLLPYFFDKLKATPDGDGGSLLDNSLIVYGSPMGNPNLHNHKRCPLFLMGKAGGALRGGLHLRAPNGTPMANAFVSALHGLGLDEIKSFGDSNGVFDLNTVTPVTAA